MNLIAYLFENANAFEIIAVFMLAIILLVILVAIIFGVIFIANNDPQEHFWR